MNAKPWMILTALLALAQSAQEATALGTAFSYQGSLTDNGNAATGNYDMQFYLRDAASGGNPVGTTNTLAPVSASNGLFTVLLDFGTGIFTGNSLWLEIGVRTNGSVSPYSTLSPRQPLTPSPYAIMANNASNLLPAANSVGGEPTQSGQIAVGDRAPLFVLKDQNDQEFSLEAMVKKGPAAVVFIRSIDWCAYCQLQTVQLSENLTRIQAAGGQVVMVCYDAPEKVKRFTRRRKIGIPILSDAGSKTIEAYAMRAVNGAGDQLGSAQHGTFVIDRSGIVRSKPYLMSFEGAAAVEALASALKQADTPR
jgi:peroxiredoxin